MPRQRSLGIRVEDVNFAKGTVTIQHLKTRFKLACPRCNARLGRSHAFCPKCGAKVEEAVVGTKEHRRVRTLPLDSNTLDMLRDYIKRGGPVSQGGRRLIFGINRHQAWRVVRDCAERAVLGKLVNPETGRVRGVSPHRLRDAFAVHAVKHGDSGDGRRLLQEHLATKTRLVGPWATAHAFNNNSKCSVPFPTRSGFGAGGKQAFAVRAHWAPRFGASQSLDSPYKGYWSGHLVSTQSK